MSTTEITVRDNGPLLVSGQDISVKDGEGKVFAAPGATIALCRCGHSKNKPFCDGSHAGNFESKPRA